MSIYITDPQSVSQSDFVPTWLYIKQHNKTGLKYFGKTTMTDPIKYKGSGTVWKRHIKKYGNDVTTVWCCLFIKKEEIVEYAIKFSIDHDIVNSKEWANLLIENGLSGSTKGIVRSEETCKKISKSRLGQRDSEETRKKKSQNAIRLFGSANPMYNKTHTPEALAKCVKYGKNNGMFGKHNTEEAKEKNRLSHLGKKPSRCSCIHCKKEIDIANLSRSHGTKCKFLKTTIDNVYRTEY